MYVLVLRWRKTPNYLPALVLRVGARRTSCSKVPALPIPPILPTLSPSVPDRPNVVSVDVNPFAAPRTSRDVTCKKSVHRPIQSQDVTGKSVSIGLYSHRMSLAKKVSTGLYSVYIGRRIICCLNGNILRGTKLLEAAVLVSFAVSSFTFLRLMS